MMLHRILDAHNGELPENAVAVFCNTGMEFPETLDFVAAMGREWNVPITWLEYHYSAEAGGGRADPKHRAVVVNHNSAARNGEPYDEMIEQRQMLPTSVMRFCTTELKIRTVERYVRRELGWNPAEVRRVVGIRADEPRRVERLFKNDTCSVEFPLYIGGVRKRDVLRFWRRQSFNLDLPEDGLKSNCTACFLKGRSKIVEIFRLHPELSGRWKGWEDKIVPLRIERGIQDPNHARFSKRWSYADLAEEAKSAEPIPEQSPDLPDLLDDDFDPDCNCTD